MPIKHVERFLRFESFVARNGAFSSEIGRSWSYFRQLLLQNFYADRLKTRSRKSKEGGYQLWRRLKRLTGLPAAVKLLNQKPIDVLIFDSGRSKFDSIGKYYDPYLYGYTGLISSKKAIACEFNISREQQEIEFIRIDGLFFIIDILSLFRRIFFEKKEKKLIRLEKKLEKIGIKTKLSESIALLTSKRKVAIAVYAHLIRRLKLKSVMFVSLSIPIGFIEACRSVGVQTIEVQHGLFDINYRHGFFSDANRPDVLLAWSDHFKNIALSHNFGLKCFAIGREDFSSFHADAQLVGGRRLLLLDSGPVITDKVASALLTIAADSKIDIFFRPHPGNRNTWSKSNPVVAKLIELGKIQLDEDRFVDLDRLSSFEYVVGVDSSLLFLACAIGLRVGCIRSESTNCLTEQNIGLVEGIDFTVFDLDCEKFEAIEEWPKCNINLIDFKFEENARSVLSGLSLREF